MAPGALEKFCQDLLPGLPASPFGCLCGRFWVAPGALKKVPQGSLGGEGLMWKLFDCFHVFAGVLACLTSVSVPRWFSVSGE